MTATAPTDARMAPARTLRWLPDLDSVIIRTARGADTYGVYPQPVPPGCRVRVTRLASYSRPGVKYTVTTDAAGHCRCDCPAGHTRKRECKHSDCISILIERGLLPAAPPMPTPVALQYGEAEIV